MMRSLVGVSYNIIDPTTLEQWNKHATNFIIVPINKHRTNLNSCGGTFSEFIVHYTGTRLRNVVRGTREYNLFNSAAQTNLIGSIKALVRAAGDKHVDGYDKQAPGAEYYPLVYVTREC